ncbi:hypothetical protein Tco_0093358 [Tanacetum coccineum]
MSLGRPFLATIHAEIDVFNKEISIGIRNDRVTCIMNKKIHNFTKPIGKVYMVNSIHNDESSSSNTPSDKSPQFEKYNNVHHENNNDNYMQERISKKGRMLKPDPNIPSMHFCKPIKQNCNGILKVRGFPSNDLIWDSRRYLTIRKKKQIKVQRNDPKRSGHRREGPKKDIGSHKKEMEFEVTSTRIHVVKMFLSGRNCSSYVITGDTSLLRIRLSRDDLLPLSFGVQSIAQGSLSF